MIRTASPADLPELRDLLARANETPYDLARVAEEKCFGRGSAGEPVVRVVERDGRIAGVAVTRGRWLRILAVDPELRRQGIGSELLRDAEVQGARVAAAEPGNYFTPGIVDTDRATLAFFARRGYRETQSTHNLDVDLGSFTGDAKRATRDDQERVLAFVEREFGRIWRFEAGRAFEHDPPTLFIAEVDGDLAGFAAHEANNRGLGFFGPTGVAASMRMRGFGRQLLLACLADLQRLGFTRAVIPWTDALAFYERSCGARPAHRFLTLVKEVDSAP